MGKKKWAVATLSVAALALLALYEVLLGRLFPFSPVVVGFSRQEYGSYVVYHHGQPESSQLSYLSEVVVVEEKYHGMPFRSKPEVFLCRERNGVRYFCQKECAFIRRESVWKKQ